MEERVHVYLDHNFNQSSLDPRVSHCSMCETPRALVYKSQILGDHRGGVDRTWNGSLALTLTIDQLPSSVSGGFSPVSQYCAFLVGYPPDKIGIHLLHYDAEPAEFAHGVMRIL